MTIVSDRFAPIASGPDIVDGLLDHNAADKKIKTIKSSKQVEGILKALTDGKELKSEFLQDWTILLAGTNASLFTKSAKQLLADYALKLANDGKHAELSKLFQQRLIKKLAGANSSLTEVATKITDYIAQLPDEKSRKQFFAQDLSKYLSSDGAGVTAYGGDTVKLRASSDPFISALPTVAFKWLQEDAEAFKKEFSSLTEGRKDGNASFRTPQIISELEASLILDQNRSTFPADGSLRFGDTVVPAITVTKEDIDNLKHTQLGKDLVAGETLNFDKWLVGILAHKDSENLGEKVSEMIKFYQVMLSRFNKLLDLQKTNPNIANQAKIRTISEQMKAIRKIFADGYGISDQLGKLITAGLQQLPENGLNMFINMNGSKEELEAIHEAFKDVQGFQNKHVKDKEFVSADQSKLKVTTYTDENTVRIEDKEIKIVNKNDDVGNAHPDAEKSIESAREAILTSVENLSTNSYNTVVKALTGQTAVDGTKLKEFTETADKFDSASAPELKTLIGSLNTVLTEYKTKGIQSTLSKGEAEKILAQYAESLLSSAALGTHETLAEAIKAKNIATPKSYAALVKIQQQINAIARRIESGKDTSKLVEELHVEIVRANGLQDNELNKTIVAYDKEIKKPGVAKQSVTDTLLKGPVSAEYLDKFKEASSTFVKSLIPQHMEDDAITQKLKNNDVLTAIFDNKETEFKATSTILAKVLKADSSHLKEVKDHLDVINLDDHSNAGPVARMLFAREEEGEDINTKLRLAGLIEIAKQAISQGANKDATIKLLARSLTGVDDKFKLETLRKSLDTAYTTVSSKEITTGVAVGAATAPKTRQFDLLVKLKDQADVLADVIIGVGNEVRQGSALAYVDFVKRFVPKDQQASVAEGIGEACQISEDTLADIKAKKLTTQAALTKLKSAEKPVAQGFMKALFGDLNQFSESSRRRPNGSALIALIRKAYTFLATAKNILGIGASTTVTRDYADVAVDTATKA